MQHTLKRIGIAASTSVLTLLATAGVAFAQTTESPILDAPATGTTLDQTQTTEGVGGVTGTENQGNRNPALVNQDDGPNWMWLLPLLAFPLIAFMLWPKKKNEEHTEYRRDNRYAYQKGGSATSADHNEEDTESTDSEETTHTHRRL